MEIKLSFSRYLTGGKHWLENLQEDWLCCALPQKAVMPVQILINYCAFSGISRVPEIFNSSCFSQIFQNCVAFGKAPGLPVGISLDQCRDLPHWIDFQKLWFSGATVCNSNLLKFERDLVSFAEVYYSSWWLGSPVNANSKFLLHLI